MSESPSPTSSHEYVSAGEYSVRKRDKSSQKQPKEGPDTSEQPLLKSVDEAYERVKGDNSYTWFYVLPIALGYSISFSYITPYLKHIPAVLCSSDDGSTWEACSKQVACSGTKDLIHKYDFTNSNTIHNIITKFGMECSPDSYIGLFGSIQFLGFTLGVLTLLNLGDILGRK